MGAKKAPTLKMKQKILHKESASFKHLETHTGLGLHPGKNTGEASSQQCPAGSLGERAGALSAAPSAGPGCAGTRLRDRCQEPGAPTALPSPRCARPALEGPELWPLSADTLGSLNAMTSPPGSAAQQEMLPASPSCSEKVRLLLRRPPRRWPRPSFGPQPGLLPPGRSAGPGALGGDAEEDALPLQWLALPSVPGDASVLNRHTGMPGDHWPWGDHSACIIERTPGQVGQKHWQAPRNRANKC